MSAEQSESHLQGLGRLSNSTPILFTDENTPILVEFVNESRMAPAAPRNHSAVIHISPPLTLDGLKSQITEAFSSNDFNVNYRGSLMCTNILTGSLPLIGITDIRFEMCWESSHIPRTELVTDEEVVLAFQVLKLRDWKGHLVAYHHVEEYNI